MSDTPKTDAVTILSSEFDFSVAVVHASFARALELENSKLLEALQAFVAAEESFRAEVISHNPENYNDALAVAYDKARAAIERATK